MNISIDPVFLISMISYSSLGGIGSEERVFEFVCETRGSADDNLNKPFHSSFHSCSEKTRPY
jgi:hypothetical protein